MERALRDKLDGGTFQDVPASHSGRMRAIKDRGNKSTEARIRAKLVQAGIRGWRLHPPGLAGKPDILFPAERLIVFVDGCYWHGCLCTARPRKVNGAYWSAKIEGNRRRDQRNTQSLEAAGYTVLRIWEHELAEAGSEVVERVRAALNAATAGSFETTHDPDEPMRKAT